MIYLLFVCSASVLLVAIFALCKYYSSHSFHVFSIAPSRKLCMTDTISMYALLFITIKGFMLIGPEKQPGSTSYIRYNGMESTPDLIPRLIVSYTSPLEGTPHLPLSERHYYNSGGSKGGRIVTTWAILLSVLLAMMMIGAVVTLHRRRQKQSTKKTDSSLHAPHAAALQGMSAADDDDDEDAVVFDDVKDLPVMAHEKEII